MRCQRCERLQAEGPQCVACGAALPEIERLDGRAIALRQAAVVALLTAEERRALTVLVTSLGLVSHWWGCRAVRETFLLVVGEREVGRRVAAGASRTAALRMVAGELGVKARTLRDAVNRLLLEKGTP